MIAMSKLFGAILLTGGGLALGAGAAGRFDTRVKNLDAWIAALGLLENELSFRAPPMPELLTGLASQTTPPVSDFFAACADALPTLWDRSFAEVWTDALNTCPMGLSEEDQARIAELGPILGRFPAEDQKRETERIRARLAENRAHASVEQHLQGKAFRAMGLALGIFLTLLLL